MTNKSKYYFLDNGNRNGLIKQFNGMDQRNDQGALWENFMFTERLKYCTYHSLYANVYFWRTYQQQEIDLVEEHDGKLYGYEFKWSPKKVVLAPASWAETDPNAEFAVIHQDNYIDFVLPKV